MTDSETPTVSPTPLSNSGNAEARIAYLILAHASPPTLTRLTETLASAGDPVFVHVDARADLEDFAGARAWATLIEDRVRVNWGGWSMVEATLRLTRTALELDPLITHVWLISGDSYPLRSPKTLRDFVTRSAATGWINILRMPAPEVDKPLSRLTHRWIEHDPRAHPELSRVVMALHRLWRRPYRRALAGWTPYCGSQWFLLTRAAAQLVLDRAAANDAFRRLARTSFVPDEHFFHTLLGNSAISDGLSPSLLYADFSPPEGPRPAHLSLTHVERLVAESKEPTTDAYGRHSYLMARKVSTDATAVIEEIHRRLWPLGTPDA